MATEGYPLIMVVEDDLDLRTIYCDLLGHNGFETAGFADAESALRALDSEAPKPGLIVLDFLLPGDVNGDQFVHSLADQPNVTKTPIILVSALSSETPEIARLKSHPWVVAFFNKADIAENKLIDFVKAYFGLN